MRLAIFMIPFILSGCATQPEVRRAPVVIYHMEGSQEAYGITETHDGRYYIISGWTDGGGEYYPPRCMLLKIDREGKLVQRKIFENLEWSCDEIKKTPQSDYILRSNHYTVFINDSLNITVSFYIPNTTPNFVVDIFDTIGGRVYMITSTYMNPTRGYHIYAFRQGELIDTNSFYFNEASDVISAVIERSGDNLYIAGRYISGDTSGYKFIKLNSDLDSLLTSFIDVKELFGYSAGYVKAMERFGDGTIAIAGTVVRGFLDAFGVIFKVDTNGNIMAYDTVDYSMTTFMDMVKLNGGDVVVVGSALRDGVFFTFIMRLRPDLSVVWYREFFGDFACYIGFGSIIQDSDGNLVIGGYCAGLDDIAFMKLNPNTGEPIVWSEW